MSPKKLLAAAVVYDGTIVFGNSRKIVQHNEAPEDVATVIYDSKHAGQSNGCRYSQRTSRLDAVNTETIARGFILKVPQIIL